MIIDEKKSCAIEVGRVCVKLAGRDAGKYCVITDIIDNSLVEITGPKKISGIKRRKCNIAHIEATADKIEIKEKAADEIIEKALEKANLVKKFKEGLKFK